MEAEQTKLCPNCKREIPAANFTVHEMHCARNICLCPVCKEPVPQADLQEHHNNMHKMAPCKKCGESVCGTDLEDHIRDSCALTVKLCRYCELELPRRELPAHEGYCGARTEQCAECRQWVMIKYRQLHLDSNHGFLRLSDDPDPTPPSSNGRLESTSSDRNIPMKTSKCNSGSSSSGESTGSIVRAIVTESVNGAIPKVPKRMNNQPQVNTTTVIPDKVNKKLPTARSSTKKRPAPPPPPPIEDPIRERSYHGALLRQQQEERARKLLNEYNAANGLPPVLTPAEKVEKLRKLDALSSWQVPDDYTKRLRQRPEPAIPAIPAAPLGHVRPTSLSVRRAAGDQFKDLKPMTNEQFMERFRELQLQGDQDNAQNGARNRDRDMRAGRSDASEGASERPGVDRFGEIKSSLSQLRRGLNQITTSYDNTNAIPASTLSNDVGGAGGDEQDGGEVPLPCEFCGVLVPAQDLVLHETGCRPDLTQRRRPTANVAPVSCSGRASPDAPVIPCEFCSKALPVYMFTEHLRKCRKQKKSRSSRSNGSSRSSSSGQSSHSSRSASRSPAPDAPVIPCEFCTESLPVYLFTEHVERCSRGRNLLFPD